MQCVVDDCSRYLIGAVQGEELLDLQIWTHPLSRIETRDEATRMCGFWIDTNTSTIVRMFAKLPVFDFDVAWSELAILEKVAMGEVVYGHFGHTN